MFRSHVGVEFRRKFQFEVRIFWFRSRRTEICKIWVTSVVT